MRGHQAASAPGLIPLVGALPEIGVREQAEGDVPVPGLPPAHFVLVQADLALGLREALLDLPGALAHLRGTA
jgi:hypothetical protein